MGKDLNFKQEIVGVFGKPVAENPTQAMMEAAFTHHGMEWRYLTLEVDPANLREAVAGARAMGFRGFNCTIPHKVEVIHHLDGLGDSASTMGAVNCVVNRNGRLIGENTDGKGFVVALEKLIEIPGTRVLIFGAGGAARAIGVELALSGAASITIVNRSEKRGRDLVDLLNTKTSVDASFVPWNRTYVLPETMDIVVNATSIGLYPDLDSRLDLDVQSLRPNMLVADVIPNPPRTRLIEDAESAGCRVIDGLGMLVNQGVIGVEYWAGITPDARVMRRALEDVFGV